MSPRICLVLVLLVPALARSRGGHHSHGGHSGHTYPASTGLSGHSTGYGQGHSTGYGQGHSTGYGQGHSTSYGQGQAATYPQSTGISGNNHATHNGNNYQSTHHTTNIHKTEIHHHYNPPQQITYGTGYHPVYYGRPPVYVYEYRDSGSRFDTLLTGLALYNLGRMSAHHDHHSYDPHREYRATPGEVCKLQISKTNGELEETRIDCKLMSSYIWEAEQERNRVVNNNVVNTNTVTTVNKVVETNTNNGTTVTSTTVTEAVQVKGPSIQINPGMDCYMIRISRDTSILKKKVECGLLQAYALRSFNRAWRDKPILVLTSLVSVVLYLL